MGSQIFTPVIELSTKRGVVSHPLDRLNLTELVELCRSAEVGNVGRATPRAEIYRMLDGAAEASCPLERKRELMEKHIKRNFNSLRTQLPGCNGKCTSFGCPDAIVQRCFDGFRNSML